METRVNRHGCNGYRLRRARGQVCRSTEIQCRSCRSWKKIVKRKLINEIWSTKSTESSSSVLVLDAICRDVYRRPKRWKLISGVKFVLVQDLSIFGGSHIRNLGGFRGPSQLNVQRKSKQVQKKKQNKNTKILRNVSSKI